MRVAFLAAEMAPHAHVGRSGRRGPVAAVGPGRRRRRGALSFLPHYDVLGRRSRASCGWPMPSRCPGSETIGLSTLGPVGDGRADRLPDRCSRACSARGAVYPVAGDDHIRYAWFTAGCDRRLCRARVGARCVPRQRLPHRHAAACMPMPPGAVGRGSGGPDYPQPCLPGALPPRMICRRWAWPGASELVVPIGHGVGNALATGILAADLVTTVSPTYAREILTPEQGMGLDEVLLRATRPTWSGSSTGSVTSGTRRPTGGFPTPTTGTRSTPSGATATLLRGTCWASCRTDAGARRRVPTDRPEGVRSLRGVGGAADRAAGAPSWPWWAPEPRSSRTCSQASGRAVPGSGRVPAGVRCRDSGI